MKTKNQGHNYASEGQHIRKRTVEEISIIRHHECDWARFFISRWSHKRGFTLTVSSSWWDCSWNWVVPSGTISEFLGQVKRADLIKKYGTIPPRHLLIMLDTFWVDFVEQYQESKKNDSTTCCYEYGGDGECRFGADCQRI